MPPPPNTPPEGWEFQLDRFRFRLEDIPDHFFFQPRDLPVGSPDLHEDRHAEYERVTEELRAIRRSRTQNSPWAPSRPRPLSMGSSRSHSSSPSVSGIASQLATRGPESTTSTTSSVSPPTWSDIQPIDYQDLHYVDDVDETLQCPICRTPFHEPITTRKCGHTFCTACLRRALDIQPVCPIDRQPMTFHPKALCNPRIVGDQLDRLRVRCPNSGCGVITTRGLISTHYERDCERTQVRCPDRTCDKLVPREIADVASNCQHRQITCQFCQKDIAFTERDTHYETECDKSTISCTACHAVVVQHRLPDHVKNQCAEAQATCKFSTHGCRFAGMRRLVLAHENQGCVYEAIGKLMKDRAEDQAVISHLRGRLTALEETRNSNHGRIRTPRFGPHDADPIPLLSDLDITTSAGNDPASSHRAFPSAGNSSNELVWESAEDYMLAQFERMETKLEDLRKTLTELDGRHSMMLLNETIPLKDQIAELRSNLGVISMHTTWLMNVQRQNRMAAGGGGGGSAAASAGQGPGQQLQQQQQQRAAGGSTSSGTGSTATTTSGTVRPSGRLEMLVDSMSRAGPRRMSGENPPRL